MIFICQLILTMMTPYAWSLSSLNNVLYIGDSHSVNAALRQKIQSDYTKNNIALDYYSSCGSNARHWLLGNYKSSCGNYNATSTTAYAKLLRKIAPKKVIINLGDNQFIWDNSKPKRAIGIQPNTKKDILEIIKQTQQTKQCYWVGPIWGMTGPLYSKPDQQVEDLYTLLRSTLKNKCTLVDCRDAVPRNTKSDGLHLESTSTSQAWAKCILEKTAPTQNVFSEETAPIQQ